MTSQSGQRTSSPAPTTNDVGNGPRAKPSLDEFRKVVLAAAIADRVKKGRKHFPPVPPEELQRVEGYLFRTEVAADLVRLMAAAREQLRIDQAGPPSPETEQARRVTRIGVCSGYRTYEQDLKAWMDNFRGYYEATETKREAAPGGPHGKAAVEILVRYYSLLKAPPGFSNHSDGRAVDFATVEAGEAYGALSKQKKEWPDLWLHRWLVANARRFRFYPITTEEWHWEHR